MQRMTLWILYAALLFSGYCLLFKICSSQYNVWFIISENVFHSLPPANRYLNVDCFNYKYQLESWTIINYS